MGFVRVAKVAEIAAGTIREVDVEGQLIALANAGGQFYAINNTCVHRGGPLGQGQLVGNMVTCPWHAWSYDVTNGKASHNPAAAVACHAVEVRDEDIFVDIAWGPKSSMP